MALSEENVKLYEESRMAMYELFCLSSKTKNDHLTTHQTLIYVNKYFLHLKLFCGWEK